jgi:hypothetical protein
MATITAIRDALATRLETIEGVRATQEWAGRINVSGSASVAVIEYAGTVNDSVFANAGDAVAFTIALLASKVSDRAGRDKLDAFCDPSPNSTDSVRGAVNGSLAGLVAFAVVASNTGYREYTVEDQAYLGVEFTVQVAT